MCLLGVVQDTKIVPFQEKSLVLDIFIIENTCDLGITSHPEDNIFSSTVQRIGNVIVLAQVSASVMQIKVFFFGKVYAFNKILISVFVQLM